MAQAYFSLVTTTGKIKLAESAAGGDVVVITHFAIGDGNGAETNPTAASTALVREVWRTPVESVVTDPDNPSAILVTAIIPTNAGGWWMREFGIFDQAGSMIAVAKPVSQYKPTALEGQLEDIRYEFQIIIGENANVTLLVDPSLLFATRAWVENRKVPMGQLIRLPWMPVLSMTLSSAPGNPVVGDIYLVPSNATGVWATNVGKLAEWNGTSWNYISPPDGHGISLPDGRVFERIAGTYVEKLALDAQSGKWNFAAATGTANALSIVINPAPVSWTALVNVPLYVRISATNTAIATLAVSGLAGTKSILRDDGTAVAAGDLVATSVALMRYDGVNVKVEGLLTSRLPTKNVFFRSTPGTVNWVVPDGVYKIRPRVWGGGGGGGGSHANNTAGAGGNGGGYAEGTYDVTPGQVLAVTVGDGGAAGTGSGTAGGTGGTSSVGALLSATGGSGGGGSQTAGNVGGAGVAGTAAGIGVGGAINIPGGGAANAYNAPWLGSPGAGAFSSSSTAPSITGGIAAVFPAGGGGGGGNWNNGATGASGMVIIEY